MDWRERVKNSSAYSAYIAYGNQNLKNNKKERKEGKKCLFKDLTQITQNTQNRINKDKNFKPLTQITQNTQIKKNEPEQALTTTSMVKKISKCLHGKSCRYLDYENSRAVCRENNQAIFDLEDCPEGLWFTVVEPVELPEKFITRRAI